MYSIPGVGGMLLQSGGGDGGLLIPLLLLVVFVLVPIAGIWKTFKKAGQPGWGALVPILNIFYLLEIADKPSWWIVLMLIPLVNFFVSIAIFIDVSKNFDRGPGYGIGLAILPFVFWPLLGFGDAQYYGDTTKGV
jgi:hypothetical protein